MAVKLTNEGIQFPNGTVNETNTSSVNEVSFYNEILVTQGPHITNAHIGGNGTWNVPQDTNTVTFHVWSGGGSGAGQCCHSCYCDIMTCAAFGGYYARKTLRKCDGDFTDGDAYAWCYGAGGNGNSDGAGDFCYTACCDAPRGCASYVNGPGLTNFCAAGGKGGYSRWCWTQSPLNQACRMENLADVGMVPGSGNNTDFAHLGSEPEQFKIRDACDCGSRWSKTSKSYGLENAHGFLLMNSRTCCGMTNCRTGFHQIAQGGSNNMKSWCGNFICCCLATPGKPGMVKIEWS